MAQHALLSPKQAAALVGVTPTTIRRWIREGSLDALRLGTAHNAPIRIPVSELADRTRLTTENRMTDPRDDDADRVGTAVPPVPAWHLDGSLDVERELLIRRERLRFLGLLDDEEGVS